MNKLTKEQKEVLINKGTERPYTGALLHNKEKGEYRCAQCNNLLFRSEKKYDSGSGWPSFSDAIPGSVELRDDDSIDMRRTEVVCKKCGGHLGHVFDDGPMPSGKRYCINSAALGFKKSKKA